MWRKKIKIVIALCLYLFDFKKRGLSLLYKYLIYGQKGVHYNAAYK